MIWGALIRTIVCSKVAALPAPLADPPTAPQPTHTRLRRARKCALRTSQPALQCAVAPVRA